MSTKKKKRAFPRCRHSKTWFIGSASHEWCSVCGALRRLVYSGQPNCFSVGSDWAYPSGPDGPDPWDRFHRSLVRRGLVSDNDNV